MKKARFMRLLMLMNLLRLSWCCWAAASAKHEKVTTTADTSRSTTPNLTTKVPLTISSPDNAHTGPLTTGCTKGKRCRAGDSSETSTAGVQPPTTTTGPTQSAAGVSSPSTGPMPSPSGTLAPNTSCSNASVSTNGTKEEPLDACAKWEHCSIHKHPLVVGWLRALPGCPCMYPRYLYISDRSRIYDPVHKREFRWHRMSNRIEKLHVYKPYARLCIRQALTDHSTAVQQCCYDNNLLLITRGSGAGTPHLVSRDIGMSVHDKVDLMPWRLCRGDWTRYHNVRPPNNALNCSQNPDDSQFALQKKKATEY